MGCLRHSLANKSSVALEEKTLLNKLAQDDRDAFWQIWKLHRNYLYHRCRIWMGGNYSDGEEALSLAMLKAWEKLPDYANEITNVKAWLTRMTHNLCVDLHRRHNRSAKGVENFEEIAVGEQNILASSAYSPESTMLRSELAMVIRQRINALSPRLRDPFILRFYKNMSYQEIAQKLNISKDNAYKRIQEARKFLQKPLQRYLSGLDESPINQKKAKLIVEESQSSETVISKSLDMTITESNIQQINYQITAICLETLVPVW